MTKMIQNKLNVRNRRKCNGIIVLLVPVVLVVLLLGTIIDVSPLNCYSTIDSSSSAVVGKSPLNVFAFQTTRVGQSTISTLESSCSFNTKYGSTFYRNHCIGGRILHDSYLTVFRKLTAYSLQENSNDVIASFISKVNISIEDGTFVSITALGPKKKRNKGKISSFDDDDNLRGCIRTVSGRLVQLRKNKSSITRSSSNVKLQVTFKYHLATDVVKNWGIPTSAVSVKSESDIVNGLSTLFGVSNENKKKEGHNVVPNSEWQRETPIAGTEFGLQSSLLEFVNGTVVEVDFPKMKLTIRQKKSENLKNESINPPQLTIAPHDRKKQFPVPVDEEFWRALGVTVDSTGKPAAGMSSKLRQCQKFVEIIDQLVSQKVTTDNKYMQKIMTKDKDELQQQDSDTTYSRNISVIDMGCGRGYLTFAVHSFLYQKYFGRVHTRGIDVRPKLVQEVNSIAALLGETFQSLRFDAGTIETYLQELHNYDANDLNQRGPTVQRNGVLHVSNDLSLLIALHACDTATDDAIWCGISSQADIIVVAPCCHKEVRPQLNHHAKSSGMHHPLTDVLRHNIYRERIAETVTDSIRAMLLESAGYTVQVFEFIGGEHTSKNVMITAVRQFRSLNVVNARDDFGFRISSLAKLHGIHYQKLAKFMNVSLADTVSSNKNTDNWKPSTSQVFKTNRLPLAMPSININEAI